MSTRRGPRSTPPSARSTSAPRRSRSWPRAIAYARIYAAAHPELSGLETKLASATATPTRTDGPALDAPPRRRGRPPKNARTELPFDRDAHGDAHGGAGAALVAEAVRGVS